MGHIENYQSITAQLAVRFHIAMYGRRVKDTLFTRWDEIIEVDGIKCVSLPEGRTKSGKPQIIPLTRHAIEVLEEAHNYSSHRECMFPQRNSNAQPITIIGISHAPRKVREMAGCEAMGDFAMRYVRGCAVTELGNAGVDRHLIDLAQ